jgi:arylsulfatase A-like enzyme
VFPHPLPGADAIGRRITAFPWMDSLTLSLALEGVGQLQLGRQPRPDLLAVSLSTTDAIGHAFGPDSREIHDQLLRVDLWLGQFMDSLARLVPRDRTIFVLTGDHGISSMPEYAVLVRHQKAGRISLAWVAAALEARLEGRFQAPFDVTFDNGLVTGDVGALRARGVNVDSLSAALAAEVQGVPGVAAVYTPATLAAAPDSVRAAHLWRRLLPSDFGWLICVSTRPGYIWSNGALGAEHGAGNPEDVEVPVAFFGAGVRAQHVERPVRSVDIAPTLAQLLMIRPTEPLDGVVLPEVVGP